MAHLLAELGDPHVSLDPPSSSPGASRVGPIRIAPVEGRVLVIGWPPGREPTVPEGADPLPELVAIDGKPFTLPLLPVILTGQRGEGVRLRLRWSDGTFAEHSLQRGPLPDNDGAKTGERASRAERAEARGKHSAPIDSRWFEVRRAGDIGYLRIKSLRVEFTGPRRSAIPEFDRALDSLLDTKGLVIDLQNNLGGRFALASAIAGRFHTRERELWYIKRKSWNPLQRSAPLGVEPRPPVYGGRVAVLVNNWTASAAELLALQLRCRAGVKLVGETTAGAEAGIETIRGPDGSRVVYGRNRVVDLVGRGIQNAGVKPDFALPLETEQVRRMGYDAANITTGIARLLQALKLVGGVDALSELGGQPASRAMLLRSLEPRGAAPPTNPAQAGRGHETTHP